MFYAITATITKRTPNGTITKQISTFYLDSNVQGIVSAEHAEKIARTIIDPFDEHEVHVYTEDSRIDEGGHEEPDYGCKDDNHFFGRE
jgi:hypothetical protein